MLNYIKAELYKYLNRPFYRGLTIACILLCITIITLATNNVTAADAIYMGMNSLIFPVFFVIILIDYTEEFKDGTLKNAIVSGISRAKIYMSKIIIATITSFILLTFISIFFVVTSIIFLKTGNLSQGFLLNSLLRIILAIPLYIASIAFAVLLSVIIKSPTAFAFTYTFIFFLANDIIKLLSMLVSKKFDIVYNILITTNINILNIKNQSLTQNIMLHSVELGIIYVILFTIIGVTIFKRMNIK